MTQFTTFKNGFASAAILSSVSSLAVSLSSVPSAAQDGLNVDEVITVTATRREELLIEVPVSLTVLRTEDTLRAGISDINALADFVPNLQATDGGAPGLGNLTIRGVYAGGAPTVGTYIDDVPYGAVVGGFAANLALDASLYDLDRIEILRGPQGTLFGASAVGGVVRYVTRQPDLSEWEGYAFGDVSTTKDGGENFLVRGRLSAPVVEDKLAVSVSGYYESGGGYIDNPILMQEDVNDFDFWGGRIDAKWKPAENVTIVAAVLHHEADYDGVGYETFDPTTGLPLFGDLQTEIETPRTLNFDLYSLTGDIDFGFASLRSITSFQNVTLVNSTDITAAFGPIADQLAPGGAPHTVGFNSGDDSDRFTQEFQLTSQSEGPIEWIVGAYYTKQDSSSFQIALPMPADVDLVDLDTSLDYEEIALFGNLTYNITDKWDFTFGVRWADNEVTIAQDFTGALSNPLLGGLENESDDSVFTWLFNTTYRVSDAANLYARIASGYRPGGSNLVVDFMGTQFGQPTFEADTLWSYEAGVKGQILDGRATYDFGAYYIDWSDAQLSFTNALGLGETGNATGGIRAIGLEASLAGEIFENFIITATLALSDIELKEDEPLINGMDGEEVFGNPDVTASLAADYYFNIGSVRSNIGATWRHTGSYTSNFMNAPTGFFENDAYSQFDLRLGAQIEHVAVNFYVTNVGNSSAYQTVFPQAPNFAYGVPLRPRTFGINGRVDF